MKPKKLLVLVTVSQLLVSKLILLSQTNVSNSPSVFTICFFESGDFALGDLGPEFSKILRERLLLLLTCVVVVARGVDVARAGPINKPLTACMLTVMYQ